MVRRSPSRERRLLRRIPWDTLGLGGIGRTTLIILAVITLAGGVLRGWQAAHPLLDRQSADEISYGRLAVSLATDLRYRYSPEGGGVPLHWPPGAPAMFAVGYALDPGPDLRAAYWLQAGVGTLTILAAFALAALLAGGIAGLFAAGLVAFYPPFVQLTAELLSEPLGALLLTSALLAVVVAWRARARWWGFAIAGAVFALAILTRADFVMAPAIPFALMAGAALLRRDRDLLLRGPVTFLVATGLVLAPWVAYASYKTGKLVPVTTGDASALFVGTYLPGEGTTYGMKRHLGDKVRERYPELRGIENYDLPAIPVLDYIAETTHPDLPREEAIRREGRNNLRKYALGQPLDFAVMMLDKFRRTWILSSRVGRDSPQRWVRVGHGFLVVFGLIVTAVAIIRLRSLELAMIVGIVLYSALVHAVFVAKPRYNLPPLPLLMVCATASTAMLWAWWRSRRGIKRPLSEGSDPATVGTLRPADEGIKR
jgi:4-amino-4-deoxy-L-arabinose transferase-like glycosyltransferase